ncbi:hypothetical protein BDW66DRAFT_133333 [Aspergillus desertorum]
MTWPLACLDRDLTAASPAGNHSSHNPRYTHPACIYPDRKGPGPASSIRYPPTGCPLAPGNNIFERSWYT